MESSGDMDPLDVLQQMVNNVLVHTGKALRASRRDGQGVARAHSALQTKLPDTLNTFHSALDELERDIIDAKSVLQRDIARLRDGGSQLEPEPEQATAPEPESKPVPVPVPPPVTDNPQQEPPQQVESQTKSPMTMDVESSPAAAGQEEQPVRDQQQRAPPATMDVDVTAATQKPSGSDLKSQTEDPAAASSAAVPVAPKQDDLFAPQAEPEAPAPAVTGEGNEVQSGVEATNPQLNFTDMEFTLDTDPIPQAQGTGQVLSFDSTSFAPPDDANAMLNLEDFLPLNPEVGAATDPSNQEGQISENQDPLQASNGGFGDDGLQFPGTGDDFDFNISPSGDMMDNHEEMNFDDSNMDMKHEFDATFFGLDKPPNDA